MKKGEVNNNTKEQFKKTEIFKWINYFLILIVKTHFVREGVEYEQINIHYKTLR